MPTAVAPRFPGRRVIAGCFIVLTTTSGLGFYGLAVYLNAFSNERDWPVASISLATTVFFLVGGVTGLLVAALLRRHDVRTIMVVGGVLGALSLLSLGHVHSRGQMYLAYAVFGVGFAFAGLVPASTVVTRWYHEGRSVALSIASTGLSAGGIALTPAAKWLTDERQLAGAMPILALVWLVGTVPFALWLVRSDPADHGWHPDGKRVEAGVAVAAPQGTPYDRAIRSRFFAAMTLAYCLSLGAQVGGIQQLVKLVEERADASTATVATTVLAAMSILARLAGGRLAQRVPIVVFGAVLMVGQGVSLLLLALAGSTMAMFVTIGLFGMTVGNILMLQPLLIADRFGVRDYPRVFSLTQLLSTVGIAGGPWVLGRLYDAAGNYETPYLVAGLSSAAGGLVLWQARRDLTDSPPSECLPLTAGVGGSG